ncbi:VVA0879 family protein [Bordetella avium]|uniref:Phage protein n=1 Tax=Bordetella avium (strain 197N) TaxID=360910 RepID=Q2L2Z7_BORA1|nr:VVA0879 family protein [Bordetella avium]CAJ48892.1 putative phage protein [Bordetella avium 197N]
MKRMTLDEFHTACKAQASSHELTTVKCPMCGTFQNALDFIAAGAGKDWGDVCGYVGFSCVGRFTGARSPRKDPDGEPCNWSLGGLFKTHELVVITPDGTEHPHFELATKDEAAAHHAAQQGEGG